MAVLEIRAGRDLEAVLDQVNVPGVKVMGAVRESFAPDALTRFAVQVKDSEALAALGQALSDWWHLAAATGVLMINGQAAPRDSESLAIWVKSVVAL